ncbi:MAG: transposase [Gammaproteobacteria bacterium]|nr:transposase [Gammaproteobacteria bacterium]
MPEYRRVWIPGGTYFFTVNLHERKNNNLLIQQIDLLREVIQRVKSKHPFTIHGWVVLPEHFHCILSLPENDSDFATRLRLIKSGFSKLVPNNEQLSESRLKRGERGIWQRRYWDRMIRDQADFNAHMDYIHINPVKHGLVNRVQDWPYSTFHKLVEQGVYELDWAGSQGADGLEYED